MERPRSSAMQLIYAELAAAKAQNVRLEEENLLLRHRINRASTDQSTSAAVNVEAKIKAFQLEEERDQIVETLQLHKKKYNKLHDAYLDKMKRCKALEETFMRQKTLTGLVMKSAIEQRNSEQKLLREKRETQQNQCAEVTVKQLEAKLAKMQTALDESYDIIDEMDFELESVDLLEIQNESLRAELAALKAQLAAASAPAPSTSVVDDEDPPPKYEAMDPVDAQAHCQHRRRDSSSSCESCLGRYDGDKDTLEREALTQSLMQTVETESNCLRRELLRSRLQRTIRAKLEKEEDDS